MTSTGLTVSEQLLDEFDDAIFQQKINGELDRNATRSDVFRMLMRAYITQVHEGNANPTMNAAASAATN